MSVPRVLAIGMSHVKALKDAAPAVQGRLEIDIIRLRKSDAASWQGTDQGIKPEIIEGRESPDLIASLIYGGWHVAGLVEDRVPYDFDIPGHDLPIDRTRKLIPFTQMRHQSGAYLDAHIAPLRSLRQIYAGRIVHFGSPPPFPEEHIRAFPGPFAAMLHKGVTPGHVRLKLWLLQTMITRSACEELGIEFVPSPEEATDSEGYLAADFRAADPGHGNAAYGALIWKRVEQMALEGVQ